MIMRIELDARQQVTVQHALQRYAAFCLDNRDKVLKDFAEPGMEPAAEDGKELVEYWERELLGVYGVLAKFAKGGCDE